MSATIVRQISNAAVTQAAAEIQERINATKARKSTKDKAREVLNSPDLRQRSSALYQALVSLKVFHPKNANQKPPNSSGALAAWCEGAQQLLRMHTADAPKRAPARAPEKIGTSVLSLAMAKDLGFKPQASQKRKGN